MAFWNSVKKAFGFSADEEDEFEEEYDSSLPTYAAGNHRGEAAETADASVSAAERRESTAAVQTEENRPTPAPAAGGDPSLPGDIFDAVIALFNETLPDFVKDCISTEQQRKYIYNSLDESLRRRLENAVAGAAGADADKLSRQVEELTASLETMKRESGRAETLKQEMKRIQLSADRQKRALCDRVNDLEQQVSSLQDEKERILTRRQGPDGAVLRRQIEAQESEIEKLKATVAEQAARIGTLSAQPEAEPQPDRSEEIEALKKEVERQTTLREQLEMKVKMSDAMINDLRSKAAEARQELEKANEDLAVVNEIQSRLEEFEEVKKRKDERIAELQEALKTVKSEVERAAGERESDRERIEKLSSENDSLRRTIENNLYNQANSESRLRREIKELQQQLASSGSRVAAEAEPQLPQQKSRRGRRPKNRVDENLDNTDWLASPRKTDSDFGYHEPPHTPVNTDDAQLSLF